MAVLKKEYYTQQNGVKVIKVVLKPTRVFPEGSNYFYAPREAESLVDSYCWYLHKHSKKGIEVIAYNHGWGTSKTLYFHKELFEFYRGYDWNEDIDHISLVELDNTNDNLNAVSHQQNGFNKFVKGYSYRKNKNHFQAKYKLNGKVYCPFSTTHREDEACIQANYVDKVILKEELGDDYYRFDFLKYRRGSEDILDLERTGQITEDEAIYQHIMRYADNAWYYLRFGLQEYFTEHNIPVPEYNLDADGFMVDRLTGKKLCPFYEK